MFVYSSKNTNMGVSEERGKSNIIREVDYRAPKARVRGAGDAYSRTARDDAAKPLVLNRVREDNLSCFEELLR